MISARLLDGFDDPALGSERWDSILSQSSVSSVFQTRFWLKTWWEHFGRGKLLLILAEREDGASLFAPLFAEAGMFYFVGAGGSDYLDFIGCNEPDLIEAVLAYALEAVPDSIGFLFHLVPDCSETPKHLPEAAHRCVLTLFEEESLSAPFLYFREDSQLAIAAANKKSLVRHERALARSGDLDLIHTTDPSRIKSSLENFFQQHIARWGETSSPSLFLKVTQRDFYRALINASDAEKHLRFTIVRWANREIAYHFGFAFGQTFLWYKPTFDQDLAEWSPGEVLLRHLLLNAVAEGVHTFDFGLGDEPFKKRFANSTRMVRNWGLYRKASMAS